jgi:hypothetical protein
MSRTTLDNGSAQGRVALPEWPTNFNVSLARIVHSGFLFRRVPEISVLIRVGESATFGAYHVWREHRECRLAVVA